MKSTARVIVPFCPTLDDALRGIGADVYKEDLGLLGEHPEFLLGSVSTVEKDGKTEGTLLYFRRCTPHDLFPHKFRKH